MTEKNVKEIASLTIKYCKKAYKNGFMHGFILGTIYSFLIIIILLNL